jgi:hypothetical protein
MPKTVSSRTTDPPLPMPVSEQKARTEQTVQKETILEFLKVFNFD